MNSIYQLHRHAPPPPPSLQFPNHPLFFTKPILSFSIITPPSPSFNLLCVKASTYTSSPKPQFHKTLIRNSCLTITAAALLLANLTHKVLPAVASPVVHPPLPAVDSVEQSEFDEEKEKNLEAFVASNPDDVKALQSLMECKVRSQKIGEALVLLDRLSSIELDNIEWLLLRANLYSLSEEYESAKKAFEDVLEKDSLCVEAYHGIVMALSQSSSGEGEFEKVLKRIELAMEICKKNDEKKEDLRDFKLLLAQVKVFEGNYGDALKLYQELALEEPRDFRPYLCQGIVYTLLRREDEAKVQFEKYRALVPEGHPYGQYLEENMFRSMGVSQGVNDETTSEKRLTN